MIFIILFLSLALLSAPQPALAEPAPEVTVKTVDFLSEAGLEVNAAGPLLVLMDEGRDRLVVANTLTSSMSVIDCATRAVKNIPIGGRALQHLKAESMTLNRSTGEIYLIGANSIHIVSPGGGTSRTVSTDAQFESIAVDERTGNIFVAGRESASLGLIKAKSKKLEPKGWLDHRENLINLNATPPPPIRKVVADSDLGRIIAVDGFTPTLYIFDARKAKLVESRPMTLTPGGRWHLAGYNEKTHCLYLVVETDQRDVVEAARIDVLDGNDMIVKLPGLREGVGIIYNPARDEVYIPYDNHPTVHVVDFANGGELSEIKIPAYGNDASAIDIESDLLYIGSWAHGEIDVIDLESRALKKRVTGLGIIPHMFSMAFDPQNNLLYFPKGASAVNGTFGAAITAFDPETERAEKIYTGWAPIDLIEVESRGGFFVFNSEDQFAEVRSDGGYETHSLPFDYPISATHSPEGDVYLSYGPHQSYWPTVYIWDAKNGVLTIDSEDLSLYDRRIPRQAHRMAMDRDGVLYFTQNNWGKEEQFVGTLQDQVRVYESNERLKLRDEVNREITQRILKYDPEENLLYLVRVGENDDDPSILQIIDAESDTVTHRVTLGRTATDLVFDDKNLYASNFDSEDISIINKSEWTVTEIATGRRPLALSQCVGEVYVINHQDNTLQKVSGGEPRGPTGQAPAADKPIKIPYQGHPDNIFQWRDRLVITSHSDKALFIVQFDPETEDFTLLHQADYPYGDTSFETRNVSFYVRGQFGDAVFRLTEGRIDAGGRLWITDILSGKLHIIERD